MKQFILTSVCGLILFGLFFAWLATPPSQPIDNTTYYRQCGENAYLAAHKAYKEGKTPQEIKDTINAWNPAPIK